MDEFNSEDTRRPNINDRRFHRQRKIPTVPKPVSKQHLIIGISILVLLVISVGLAIRSSSRTDFARQGAGNNDQSNIDFSSLTSGSGASQFSLSATTAAKITPSDTGAPQELNTPQITQNPTGAAPVTQPNRQQRIELPGNMINVLSQQENHVNDIASQQMNGQGPVLTLPTVSIKAPPSDTLREPKQTSMMPSASRQTIGATKVQLAPTHHSAPASSFLTSGDAARSIQSAPTGYYTLQLSSASQPATLNAYARKQQLSQYWIYETYRDGKSWYVLVNGIYSSLSQAKSAMAHLPADMQAKKPWVRQIGQVKQDNNN